MLKYFHTRAVLRGPRLLTNLGEGGSSVEVELADAGVLLESTIRCCRAEPRPLFEVAGVLFVFDRGE